MTQADTGEPGTVTDVVCGMTIERASAAGTSDHAGTSYYFCSPSCKSKFDADPGRYVRGSAANG